MNLDNFKQGGVRITTVSVCNADWTFVKQGHYSFTRILRKAIDDLRNSKNYDGLQEMYAKAEKQAKIIQNAMEFLEKQGKSDEFFRFQDIKEEEGLRVHKEKKVEVSKEEIEKECDEVLNIK